MNRLVNQISFFLPIIAVLIFCFLPNIAGAQEFTSILGDVPFLSEGSITDSGQLVNALYVLSITLAAILVVIRLIWAGVNYMFSEVVPDKAAAKKDIQSALIGLLIVLGAVTILDTINSDITGISVIPDVSFEDTRVNTDPILGPGIEAMLSDRNNPLFGAIPTGYSCGGVDMVSCEEIIRQCNESETCLDYILQNGSSPVVIVLRKPPSDTNVNTGGNVVTVSNLDDCKEQGGFFSNTEALGKLCHLGEIIESYDTQIACGDILVTSYWDSVNEVCRQNPIGAAGIVRDLPEDINDYVSAYGSDGYRLACANQYGNVWSYDNANNVCINTSGTELSHDSE